MKKFMFVVMFFVCSTLYGEDISKQKLEAVALVQEASITLKSNNSEGSGNVITRELIVDEDGKKAKINFILTAGHVIDGLRKVREIIDTRGQTRKMVEFDDASIVREFRQAGRRIGETKLECKVIQFSDAENGEDIALLMVRKYDSGDFAGKSIEFWLKEEIPSVGTDLFHVGSLLGQMGANSYTAGNMSQIGRVYQNKTYDQTTVTAFPGSSGGGVFLMDNGKPLYMGMIVRGAGETFNLLVPIRRIIEWSKINKMEWIFNPTVKAPTLKELLELPIENSMRDAGRKESKTEDAKPTIHTMEIKKEDTKRPNEFPFIGQNIEEL